MSEVSPPPRAGPGPAPLSFPREACSAQVLALPPGVGAVQTRPPDMGQHFRSPGQSTSRVHGEVDASGPTTGQIPGLDANSEDRFRAGGASDQSSGRCWQQSLFFFFFLFFRAAPVAYGSSQARGQIKPAAAGLHHSLSNAGPKLHLRIIP